MSPLSGHTAALIGWRFFVRYAMNRDRNAGDVEQFDLLWSSVRGGDALIDVGGRAVLVPNENLTLTSAINTGHGIPLEGPLPPDLAHIMSLPLAQRGLMFYSELLLRNGDAVRLRGKVEAREKGAQSAYRSSGERKPDFAARPDLGALILEDRSVT